MSNTEIKNISNLVNINKDAAEFYFESADELAEDPQLKSTFRNLGDLHNDVASNLKKHLMTRGETDIDADETVVGEMSKFWGKLKARISNDVDTTLVVQLEEAEDRCLHQMQNIMKNDDIDHNTKAVLQREFTALRKSHDFMKDMKDHMQAA